MRILLFLSLFISASCLAQEAVFHCDKPTVKLDKVDEGATVEHSFIIENKGKRTLIISGYKVACPCTKVYLPKEPIQPGHSVAIKVVFDTNGKAFYQDRTILLTTNCAKPEKKLRFKVYVKPKTN